MAKRTSARDRHNAAQQRQRQALAEGMNRPDPILAPASQENTWVDRAVAAQAAAEEADRQRRAAKKTQDQE